MCELEKMLAGEVFDGNDQSIAVLRNQGQFYLTQLNQTPNSDTEQRTKICQQLFAAFDDTSLIRSPFVCEFGSNIIIGQNTLINFQVTILDVSSVIIGNNVLIAPNVQLYTASHPLNTKQRRKWEVYGKPIVIEDDVWLGGGVIVCPGVKIGQGSVIGAGAVVTQSIPEGVLAAGNPCRIIRSLTEEEMNTSAPNDVTAMTG
ncbi:sugar O-acetyltransferase [Zooshikella ganghwensis]|uniref:Acetyltransferase n=1 Tax=Zooshikella ganghwensis TaxID=202772 RepID=A0A4P9VKQ5_9GAMM|nr:sugar O-acetyltransferase [Zooshikella ganghwensis]RDH43885.1 sugar O-acetyltransferase [Zooshikella ganghwensis]